MRNLLKTILLTGLFVGTTDILLAFVSSFASSGNFPEKMLNRIAGAAIGLERSLEIGTPAAFLGLFFHYFIAMSWTAFFFVIFPKLNFLRFNKYLVGMLYAVFINLVMAYIILPMTTLPGGNPFILPRAFVGWVLLGVVLGIPIVYNTYKYYGVPDDEPNAAKY
jgi:hypothetical protein